MVEVIERRSLSLSRFYREVIEALLGSPRSILNRKERARDQYDVLKLTATLTTYSKVREPSQRMQ
jgi:hypothetical protein